MNHLLTNSRLNQGGGVLLLLVGLSACVGEPLTLQPLDAGTANDAGVSDDAPSDGDAQADAALPDGDASEGGDGVMEPLPAGREVALGGFTTAQGCAPCHSASSQSQAMRDIWGDDVSPFNLWQSSMMALSSRDPVWRAVVSAEMVRTPAAAKAIEAECMKCHAPMASRAAEAMGAEVGLETLHTDSALGQLALDGISCTLCHQISPQGLGTEASFSGKFEIAGQGEIYGPYQDVLEGPMVERTGYVPAYAEHISSSALCGSCHVLETPTLAEGGQATGHTFLEQATFLEWRNSVYRTGPDAGAKARDCQHCHMPSTDSLGGPITSSIARRPDGGDFDGVQARAPFRRHTLVGGNVAVLEMIRQARDWIAPDVPEAALLETIRLSRQQLSGELGGRVSVEGVQQFGQVLQIRVAVRHNAGHKFPTGFPSRRMWVRLEVLGQGGQRLFVSGGVDGGGRIVDGQGQPLESELPGGGFQPHYTTITAPHQVQIYEAVMGDPQQNPTTTLLRASNHLKDNRILPEGYSDQGPDAARTAPVGVGLDEDFLNGGDGVVYEVAIDPGQGPVQIKATLFYQSLSARFMAELFELSTPEIDFVKMFYQGTVAQPVEVATDTLDF